MRQLESKPLHLEMEGLEPYSGLMWALEQDGVIWTNTDGATGGGDLWMFCKFLQADIKMVGDTGRYQELHASNWRSD